MKYDKHSYDFSGGVKIEPSQIDLWHKKVLKDLKKTNSHFSCVSSGNGFVIGVKFKNGEIKILECMSGFKEHFYIPNGK